MALWGSTLAVVRALVGGGEAPVSPMLLVAVRMALASALLLAWLGARGDLRFSRELWRDGLLCAALLGGGFLLQIEGQHRTTASRSGFLTGLLVVFVPLIELLLFRKRPSAPAAAGIALAFTGMALLSTGGAAGQARLLGDLLTVGCAVVFAGHIIALGRVAGRHPGPPPLPRPVGGPLRPGRRRGAVRGAAAFPLRSARIGSAPVSFRVRPAARLRGADLGAAAAAAGPDGAALRARAGLRGGLGSGADR